MSTIMDRPPTAERPPKPAITSDPDLDRIPIVVSNRQITPPETAESTIYASPAVAAAFAGGIAYMWLEAAFRLVFTYTSLPNTYMLWNGRVGDIGAMWLTMSVVSLLVFFGLGFWAFKGKEHVGTIMMWTVLLIISALVAPLIGEIGTSMGI